jgi:hypothetical protein
MYTTRIDMGETTTLALNTANKASLRTTIPMFIVKQWNLRQGDQLDWQMEAHPTTRELVVVVRKSGKKIMQTGIPAAEFRKEMDKQTRKRIRVPHAPDIKK